MVEENIQKLSKMMQGLLDLSRIQNVQHQVCRTATRACLDDCLASLEDNIRLSQATLDIKGEWPVADMPAAQVSRQSPASLSA